MAVEIHVEPGGGQGPGLALLDRLAPDELLDVGVVDVEDDHLGRPAGLSPGVVRHGVVDEVLVDALDGQVVGDVLLVGLDDHRHVDLIAVGEAGQRPVELGRERLLHRRRPGQAHAVGVGVVAVGGDRHPQRRPAEADPLELLIDVGEEPVGLETGGAAQRRLQQSGLALRHEADQLGEPAHTLLADNPHPVEAGTARGGGPDVGRVGVGRRRSLGGDALAVPGRGRRDGLGHLRRNADREEETVRLEGNGAAPGPQRGDTVLHVPVGLEQAGQEGGPHGGRRRPHEAGDRLRSVAPQAVDLEEAGHPGRADRGRRSVAAPHGAGVDVVPEHALGEVAVPLDEGLVLPVEVDVERPAAGERLETALAVGPAEPDGERLVEDRRQRRLADAGRLLGLEQLERAVVGVAEVDHHVVVGAQPAGLPPHLALGAPHPELVLRSADDLVAQTRPHLDQRTDAVVVHRFHGLHAEPGEDLPARSHGPDGDDAVVGHEVGVGVEALDGAGRGVGTPHEADRAASRAAAGQGLER